MIPWIVGTSVGAALAAVIVWLFMRGQAAAARALAATHKEEALSSRTRIEGLQADVRQAAEDRARAQQELAHLKGVESQLDEARRDNGTLRQEAEGMREKLRGADEKTAWLEKAEAQLRDVFQSLSSAALRSNAEEFIKQASKQLETIRAEMSGDLTTNKEAIKKSVEPLETALKTLDEQVRGLETARQGAYSELGEQLRQLSTAHTQLQTTTTTLAEALKSSSVRAHWGEMQLKRVVTLAHMTEHVSYKEQEQTETEQGRPDLVVYLPQSGVLPVDSKASMKAYLEAMECTDEKARLNFLELHAQTLRGRIRELGGKAYWQQFQSAPEFVVMFVPSESCLAAAFQVDSGLMEYAFEHKVVIATPVTLMALLKAVAYGWQQHQMTEHARDIAALGQELYKRLNALLGKVQETGAALNTTVEKYNGLVASLEGRMLPWGRRFKDVGVANEDLHPVEPVDLKARQLMAPETMTNQDATGS